MNYLKRWKAIKKKYKKYFYFIYIGLLIVDIDENNKNLILKMTNSMLEDPSRENLSLEEIETILKNLNSKYSIKGKQININYQNKNFIID